MDFGYSAAVHRLCECISRWYCQRATNRSPDAEPRVLYYNQTSFVSEISYAWPWILHIVITPDIFNFITDRQNPNVTDYTPHNQEIYNKSVASYSDTHIIFDHIGTKNINGNFAHFSLEHDRRSIIYFGTRNPPADNNSPNSNHKRFQLNYTDIHTGIINIKPLCTVPQYTSDRGNDQRYTCHHICTRNRKEIRTASYDNRYCRHSRGHWIDHIGDLQMET